VNEVWKISKIRGIQDTNRALVFRIRRRRKRKKERNKRRKREGNKGRGQKGRNERINNKDK
jgi:hypothetical protein